MVTTTPPDDIDIIEDELSNLLLENHITIENEHVCDCDNRTFKETIEEHDKTAVNRCENCEGLYHTLLIRGNFI